MKQKKKLQIAKTCHEVHNVLCAANGMQVIPWEEKSPEHQAIVISSVDKILNGILTTPEESHMNFMFMKREDGWKYGDSYSTRNKTNPRLCEWDELEEIERQKEEYFFAVVNSFKK